MDVPYPYARPVKVVGNGVWRILLSFPWPKKIVMSKSEDTRIDWNRVFKKVGPAQTMVWTI